MAVAVKTRAFPTANDLAAFCADVANSVTTVLSIVSDNNGQFVLFYV